MDKENKKKSINKNIVIFAAVLILGVGTAFYMGKQKGRTLPATSRHYSSNKVVATVGDVKITEKDLKNRMEPIFYMNGKNKMTDEQIDKYEQSMIDYMTTTEMLYQEGVKNKVKLDTKEIDSQYSAFMASITQTFGMDEEKFLKEFGLTKEEIKKSVEKEAIAAKYIDKESKVTDKEVEEYFNKNKKDLNEIKASHILIKNIDENGKKLDDAKIKENKKLAESILKKALEGENFEELAKKYSEDGSAQSGGDLGFFSKGAMVAEFEKAAFGLNKGEIYPKLVETQFGYHIIKKTDEKEKTFDDIKDSLTKQLVAEKQDALIQKLTKEYKVDVKK
ncbi:peptidyl-prolyl cis-trans isomerase [[Clostridium] sordellii]|uniref:peptidylprolyl isomerase n=1 Tax=Paraclostridium sordellii TaxID=1505 RepID=UPI0005E98098|nr:peptidylprolyl isomerase [Paeniclostridium sordellii]CEN84990.1 peptidyl-prolyl cis-trans isomerase [[Clostridium] sordellii] [Paeniclostridium sordellii]CEQ09308.1 peptidyl-prolyl cis-trans isomerase [[Clostridium] sordellii] [Paeniclostridium sordellii]CEQ22208.1 peptidyl-prolyl cis-trans isomerase [[Clostridium] sordellii] [Paeniclostridium sordellii]CEQ30899.1 peptidyl-prolyl cis-trans isomerase [[Clostridium] sordellii] [Paeniclostridium sordellii]